MSQYLVNFKKFLPQVLIRQEDSINWLKEYLPDEFNKYIEKFSVPPKYIASRRVFKNTGIGSYDNKSNLYKFDEKIQPNLGDRSDKAQLAVKDVFKELYEDINESPDDLIHVSCTHYQSPSGAQELVVDKDWISDTRVTHAYHMGCYASLPALRIARGFNFSGSGITDIVHTELCSFHLDKEDCTPEQIIMKTLFSDGAMKYSSVDENMFKKLNTNGFKVLALHEEIVADSKNEMTWKLKPNSFSMTLSTKVPKLLSSSINDFMKKLFKLADLDFEKDKDLCSFAIHPGGPKIVDLVQEDLDLSDDQIKYSKEVLLARGNMSSATLPHIWELTLKEEQRDYVCTVAFGPGLTITGAMFKICRP